MTSLTVLTANGGQVILLNRHNFAVYSVAVYENSTKVTVVFDVALALVATVRAARSRVTS